jgi:hypothetical protein
MFYSSVRSASPALIRRIKFIQLTNKYTLVLRM